MKIKAPIWFFECASGPIDNEARYQTVLLRQGWSALTPSIRHYMDWCEGEGTLGFPLPYGRHDSEMDFDALSRARSGERGEKARRLAETFDGYMHAIRNAYPQARILLYLGGVVECESLNTILVQQGYGAWKARVDETLDPLLKMDRLDIAIDNSAGLDNRAHVGNYLIDRIERELVDGKLYVEGVPTPRPGKRVMLERNCICLEPNWTRATTDNPDATIDPGLLKGEVVRLFNGHFFTPVGAPHRHNAFDEDPIRYLGDVTRRGHRMAADTRGLTEFLGAANLTKFREIAGEAAEVRP